MKDRSFLEAQASKLDVLLDLMSSSYKDEFVIGDKSVKFSCPEKGFALIYNIMNAGYLKFNLVDLFAVVLLKDLVPAVFAPFEQIRESKYYEDDAEFLADFLNNHKILDVFYAVADAKSFDVINIKNIEDVLGLLLNDEPMKSEVLQMLETKVEDTHRVVEITGTVVVKGEERTYLLEERKLEDISFAAWCFLLMFVVYMCSSWEMSLNINTNLVFRTRLDMAYKRVMSKVLKDPCYSSYEKEFELARNENACFVLFCEELLNKMMVKKR